MNYSCGVPGDKGTVTNSLEMAWPLWGPQEDMDFIITWSCLVLRGRPVADASRIWSGASAQGWAR